MPLRRHLLTLAALSSTLLAGQAHAQAVLKVATDATFPPMEFFDNGQRAADDPRRDA
jgi:polar amino acid transport system substrate-binding protein